MPIDTELRLLLLLLARFCKMHLCLFSCVDGLAVHCELFFTYSQFFESFRQLERDSVFVDLAFQLNLNFKSHRHVCAPKEEVFRLHEATYSVRAPRDLL